MQRRPCWRGDDVAAITSLETNHASEVVKDHDLGQLLLDKLMKKIDPHLLRERMLMSREMQTEDQKGDVSLITQTLAKLAVEVNLNEVAAKRLVHRFDRSRGKGTRDSVPPASRSTFPKIRLSP